MNDYRTRKRPRGNFLHSWLALLFLGFILGVFIKSTYASFHKKSQAEIEGERYRTELRELESNKEALRKKIELLRTQRGREAEYRKRFNVVKDGETMIRIIEDESE